MRWNHIPLPPDQVNALSRQLALSPTATSILFRLGIKNREAAERFLHPRLQHLDDPFCLTHLDRAVERLRYAMKSGEEIVIFGDYDVDGVTSTTLLVSILHHYGIFPRYFVPRRLEEGYGLTRGAIDRVLEEGIPGLLMAVDCGTTSCAEVAYLREHGVNVIIIDHHASKASLPQDCILVNPHVFDGKTVPWSDLCSVGLVFKLVHGLLKQLREEGDEMAHRIPLKDYLDLVALGTIADLVPLRRENRILAKTGLRRLQNTQRLGLKALFGVSGMTLGTEVSPFDISFRLGPRINASGRLADASLPVEMLLCSDWNRCDKVAHMLNDFNNERQKIERHIFLSAQQVVENSFPDAAGLVIYNHDWHPGVVGVVASRLVQKYNRPSIVLGTEGTLAKGSGRSIPDINLVEVLQSCNQLLKRWGGHPMAVGIALELANLEAFQEAFHEAVADSVGGIIPPKEIELAVWVKVSDIGEALLGELDRLHPFGQGNPEPVFGLRRVVLKRDPVVFGQGHLRFQIDTGSGRLISGVAWRKAPVDAAAQAPFLPVNQPLDMAIKLQWNSWNGRRCPQVELVAWRPSRGE